MSERERSLDPTILDGIVRAGFPGAAVSLRGSPVPRGDRAFGRYEGAEAIGQGGMGVIVRALDPELGRAVAIKVLRGRPSPQILARFVREARVAGQLEHPNIAPVYELGRTKAGEIYFSMKLVRGRSLAEELASLAGRPAELARERPRLLADFLKVLDAVSYAHSRGVIHRDLKPANIMIGLFGEVLVMDWGIAKVRGLGTEDRGPAEGGSANPADAQETAAGSILGTPAYMPPEQATGEMSRVDDKSDVYALGAVLYEILTGSAPFPERNVVEIYAKSSAGELERPSVRAPEARIGRELDSVVTRAMAPSRSRRYGSVQELRSEIEAFLSGSRLRAAEYRPHEVLVKWARRNRAKVLGVAATLTAAIAGLVGIVLVRRHDESNAMEARVARAQEAFERGLSAWDMAQREAPMNPAAPQTYFQRHLAPLLDLARGLEHHPSGPRAWRDLAADRAGELQRRAEEVGDWALARILAESAFGWGAVDEAGREVRIAQVQHAEDEALAADARRLDEVLARIREVEEASRSGGKSGLFVPGELDERGRRLALATRPEFTRVLIARLVDRSAASGLARRLLIEILGRKGDVRTVEAGVTSIDLVTGALDEAIRAPGGSPTEETVAWVRAAARLEARSPGAFPDVVRTLDGIASLHETNAVVARAVRLAKGHLESIAARAPSASATRDPDRFREEILELAQWAVAMARSGPAYTGLLVAAAAREEDLTSGGAAFVYDQLGLRGDVSTPDPDRPDLSAARILRRALDRLPKHWLGDEPPADAEPGRWNRTRILASAAAINLSRLGDPAIARELIELTDSFGGESRFEVETCVALVLAPAPANGLAGPSELLARGMTRHKQGDFEGAKIDFTRAIDADPTNAKSYNLRGIARADLGDHAGAIEDYTRAVEIDAAYAEAYNNRGIEWAALGDSEAAILDFTRALDARPAYAMAYFNRGMRRAVLGDYSGAIEDYTSALAIDPSPARTHAARGEARELSGDHAGAFADLSRAIELDPSNPFAHARRAEVRRHLGDRPGALEDASRAIELNPTRVLAHVERAQGRAAAGDSTGAIEDLTRALELDPRRIDALLLRGALRRQSGDSRGAIEDFSTAIELEPRESMARNNRGNARLDLGDLSGAREDYGMAIELDPTNAGAHANLGGLCYQEGDFPRALESYDRAIAIDPGKWLFWANRSLALVAVGRRAEAQASFDEAIRRAPPSDRAQAERLRRDWLGR